MKIESGSSMKPDARAAIEEASKKWQTAGSPDFIFVFHSTNQDPREVAAEISRRFPKVPFAGCTSTGEHLNGKHFNGSLVISAIYAKEIRWRVAVIENIKDMNEKAARNAVDSLLSELNISRDEINPEKQFCMTFIDGLSLKEELVSSLVAEALDGIPLIGGSAGDDLKFLKTYVIANGRSYENAAVLVMADSQVPFQVIKHQHFLKTPKQLVITKVDPATRTVYEMDGLPAAEAYAKAIGVDLKTLNADIAFVNPLMFRVNNEFYVRSVQKINDDGSIVFYCGVEEGVVLEVGHHEVIDDALSLELKELQLKGLQKAELFIVCNCILRALETTKEDKHNSLGQLINTISPSVIGFDTYGEQLNGLHINQTLVGIALGRAA